jgi:putative type-1 restriction enzyme hindVIIP specificity protein
MSDWKEYTLGDVLELVIDHRGKTPKKLGFDDFFTNGYPVLSAKHVKTSGLVNLDAMRFANEEMYKKWMKEPTQKGDVILTSEAPLGELFYIDGSTQYVLGQRVFGLRPKIDILEPKYLLVWLTSAEGQSRLQARATGSTVQGIKQSELLKIIIPIPPLEIQKIISEIYGSLDEKIQLNTQINKTLEQIAQALFKSWFVDFDPVRAKVQALSDGLNLEQAELAAMQAISGKTPEELTALSQTQPDRYAELAETAKAFPCEMVEVDGVEVPKGWEVKELGSLMTIKRGGSPRPIKDFISDKGLNWVKISDATAEDNPFLFSTKEYIKSEGLSKTVLLNKGSLILSNSATPGLPRFLELDACIHDGWLYFSDIKRLTQEYLYFFFLNIRNDLVAQGNGSVFTNLKTDIVKAQKAIVPDERVICYFDKQVKSIMNLIRYNTANSISLKETRDLLLPRLLNGEI